jgi:hypothetical protein
MAHEILCEWMDRAMSDADFSGMDDESRRKGWVASMLKQVDEMYDQTLGLCLCPKVQCAVQLRDQALSEEEAVMAITAPAEDVATEEEKIKMQRLWKKNMNADVEKRKQKMQKQLESQIPV